MQSPHRYDAGGGVGPPVQLQGRGRSKVGPWPWRVWQVGLDLRVEYKKRLGCRRNRGGLRKEGRLLMSCVQGFNGFKGFSVTKIKH
jgi:hypothetical protein